MRVVVGDETGLVKVVDTATEASTVLGQQTRENCIDFLCWAQPYSDRRLELCAAQR